MKKMLIVAMLAALFISAPLPSSAKGKKELYPAPTGKLGTWGGYTWYVFPPVGIKVDPTPTVKGGAQAAAAPFKAVKGLRSGFVNRAKLERRMAEEKKKQNKDQKNTPKKKDEKKNSSK